MGYLDDFLGKLDEYGKYIDSEGRIKDLKDAYFKGGAPAIADLVLQNYDRGGFTDALGTFTGLASVPKRALVDIPSHEIGEALIGASGKAPIRPTEEVAVEALFPDERISGETPSLSGARDWEKHPTQPSLEGGGEIRTTPLTPEEIQAQKEADRFADQARHAARGITRPVVQFGTDPLVPAMMVSGPVGAISGAAFVPEMAKTGGEQLGTAIANEESGDAGAAIENALGGAASLGMAGIGGIHTGKGLAREVSPFVPEIATRSVVWEAPKTETPIDLSKPIASQADSTSITKDTPESVMQYLPKWEILKEARILADQEARGKGLDFDWATVPEERFIEQAKRNLVPLALEYKDFKIGIDRIINEEMYPNEANRVNAREVTPVGPNYLEVKPLVTETIPRAIDTTARGLGWNEDPFENLKSRVVDDYKGPYNDIEKDLENTLGEETPTTLPTTKAAPKNRILPNIPKTGGEDIRSAIDKRTREIKDQVVGIDPVKARKLAMLDIAREQSVKARETTIFGVEKKNIGRTVTTIEGNKTGTVIDMFGGGASDRGINAGSRTTPPSYKIKFEDGSEEIVNARGLRFAPKEAEVKPSQVEGTTPEVRAITEKTKELESIETKEPEVSEIIRPKRYYVTMEDGSTHIFKGADEGKVRDFAVEKFGPVAEIRELAKFERAGNRKPPNQPPIKPPSNEPPSSGGPKVPELKSEKNPTEASLFDDITDFPKTLKSSWDLSFPLRQGYFLLNRPTALKAMAKGTKSAFGERYHLEVQDNLANRPNAELYKQFGLNQIKYDPTEFGEISEQHPIFAREPSAFGKAVQKIPGLKQSERAFTDSGNLVRADMFDYFKDKWSKEGKTPDTRPDLYLGLAKYLNVLTGRDPLPVKLQQAGYILNKLFWSPQYTKSRLQLLNPVFYAKLPREVQTAAIRDIGGTLATTAALMSVAAYAAKQSGRDDVSVNWNPTHTDFGKLKVGKTKYDFFTGLVPIIRTAARITTSRKETPKGEYKLKGGFDLLNDRFNPPTEYLPVAPFGQSAATEFGNFVEGKTAPIYQAGRGILSGKDYYGNEYGIPEFLSDIAAPMSASDIIDAWRNYDAEEGIKAIPSLFGVGVQVERKKENQFGAMNPNRKGKKKHVPLLF